MLKRFVFILLLLSSLNSWAQDNLYKEEMTDRFQEFKKASLAQLSSLTWFHSDTFGVIQAQFGKTSGNFYQSQDAPDRREMSFFSEGLKKINKIRFYGSFDFEYFRADSVANTLQYGYSDETPYYFYAFRKGSWGGLKYDFNGMADWEINSKLNFLFGLKYKAENKWRKIDPRPEVFDQTQAYSAALQWKINPQNSFTIGAAIIAKNFETTVGYMNKDLTDRYSDSIYINYIMYGYGYGLYWTTDRNIYKTSKGNNLQLSYAYQNDRFSAYTSFKYEHLKEDVTQKLTGSEELSNSWFGIVDYATVNAQAFLKYRFKNHHLYSQIAYQSYLVEDDNKKLLIKNYTNDRKNYRLLLGDLILKNNKPNWELKLDGNYQEWYRRDAAQGLVQQYDNIHLNFGVTKFFHFKEENFLSVLISGGIVEPIESFLKLPGIENTFINRIVKYDYYFYNASIKESSLNIQYNFPIKNLTTYVGFLGKFQFAQLNKGNIISRSYPGSTRNLFQLRFGLFL